MDYIMQMAFSITNPDNNSVDTAVTPTKRYKDINIKLKQASVIADEISSMLYGIPEKKRPEIHRSSDVAKLLTPILRVLDQEELWVITLTSRNRVIQMERIYRGTVDSASIRISEVFKPAVISNAAGIIIAHNHPAGDPSPSAEDVSTTRNIVNGGKTLDIEVLDHLIFGHTQYASLKERGLWPE